MPRGNPLRKRSNNSGQCSHQNEEVQGSQEPQMTQTTPTTSEVPETPQTQGSEHLETSPSTMGSHSRVLLDPTGLWFDEEEVKATITGAIKGYYEHPWTNYSSVDQDTKDRWFFQFRQKYSWREELTASVRKAFDKYCTARVRGMFYTVTQKMNKRRPSWIDEDVHQKMFEVLESDRKYKRRSEQNKKNRRGGSMENNVEATHFQGSISGAQHARKLAAKNNGKLPEPADLFRHTHFKEVPNIGRVPANRTAQQINDEFERLQTESQSSDAGTQRSPNDIFFEATGGRNKKGRVRGLGKGAELYYANSSRSSGSSTQYSQPILSQMEERFETRIEAERARLEATIDARIQAERDQMKAEFEAQMKEKMEQMLQQFTGLTTPFGCSNLSPHQRDPPNGDDGTSGGLGQSIPVVR